MNGYERLSRLPGSYPELAINQKLITLSAPWLLYDQAELQHLENEVRIISQTDARDSKKSVPTLSWQALNEALGDSVDLQKRKNIGNRR